MINLKKIELGIDMHQLRKEMDAAEWNISYDGMSMEKSVYLGSCLSLAPSGKYYLPFACSNVLGDCETCKGTGVKLRFIARQADGWIKRKQDGTAIIAPFPLKERRRLARAKARGMRLWKRQRRIQDSGSPYKQSTINRLVEKRMLDWNSDSKKSDEMCCTDCNGEGSNSAAADQIWYEMLDEALEEHGWYRGDSEGDGCDILVSESRELESGDDIECPSCTLKFDFDDMHWHEGSLFCSECYDEETRDEEED